MSLFSPLSLTLLLISFVSSILTLILAGKKKGKLLLYFSLLHWLFAFGYYLFGIRGDQMADMGFMLLSFPIYGIFLLILYLVSKFKPK